MEQSRHIGHDQDHPPAANDQSFVLSRQYQEDEDYRQDKTRTWPCFLPER